MGGAVLKERTADMEPFCATGRQVYVMAWYTREAGARHQGSGDRQQQQNRV